MWIDSTKLLEAVIRPKSALYLSAPITTGLRRRVLEGTLGRALDVDDWEDAALLSSQVILPNIDHALAVEENLRNSNAIIINPARFHMPDWGQEEYMALWKEVIRTFAHSLAFCDGWETSTGCVQEHAWAEEWNIPCYDERLHRLEPEGE